MGFCHREYYGGKSIWLAEVIPQPQSQLKHLLQNLYMETTLTREDKITC